MNLSITIDDNDNPVFQTEGKLDFNELLKGAIDKKEIKTLFSEKISKVFDSIKLDNKKINTDIIKNINDIFEFKGLSKEFNKNLKTKFDSILSGIKVDSGLISNQIKSVFDFKDIKKDLDKKIKASIPSGVVDKISIEKNPDSYKGISILDISPSVEQKLTKAFKNSLSDLYKIQEQSLQQQKYEFAEAQERQKEQDTVFKDQQKPDLDKSYFENFFKTFKEKTEKPVKEEDKKSSAWGWVGGLIGAAILAWMNKDKIAKWWNEQGRPFWEDTVRPLIGKYITGPLEEWFNNKIKNTELYKKFKEWQDKPFIVKIADVLGMTTDDETTGIRKRIDLWILNKIGKFWNTVTKPFMAVGKFVMDFFKGPTAAKTGEELIEKAVPKIFGKEISSKLGPKVLEFFSKRLTFIPGIGVLIGLGFGISRIVKGDVLGGLIDIASGIAAVFPGIGTAISIALSVINIGRDIKYGGPSGAAEKSGFNRWWNNDLPKLLKKIPGISSLIYTAEAIGHFSAGDWKSGFLKLTLALPIIGSLYSLFFEEKAEKAAAKEGKGIGEYIFEKLTTWIGGIIESIISFFANIGEEVKKWAIEKASRAWTSIKEGATDVFSGVKTFFTGDKQSEKRTETTAQQPTTTPKQAKDKIVSITYNNKIIEQTQLSSSDKLETMGNSSVFSQEGGTLDKSFKNMTDIMNKQLVELSNLKSYFMKGFEGLIKINNEINNNLGNIAAISANSSKPPVTEKAPDGYIRDPIYEFRMRLREV